MRSADTLIANVTGRHLNARNVNVCHAGAGWLCARGSSMLVACQSIQRGGGLILVVDDSVVVVQ